MMLRNVTQKCLNSPYLGLVGCQSAPNSFPLAKERVPLVKGKRFEI